MARPGSTSSTPTARPPLRAVAWSLLRLSRNAWQDVLALSALLAVAAVLNRDFFGGDYLPQTYGDWISHAYRIRFLQEHGFETWDHNWAGGLSLFQSYQFVPHAITAAVSTQMNASITRSMLLVEGLLLVWVGTSGYLAARLLALPPAAALVAGVATLGLNDYASAAYGFSLLWGLAALPLLLVAAYRYADRPGIYPIAVLVGLGVYVHPHLAVAGVVALLAAWLTRPPIIGRVVRLVAQGLLVALAAAFYWVPAFFSAQPVFHDPYPASTRFMHVMFDGELARFSGGLWLLAPLALVSTVLCRRQVRAPLLRYVGTFLVLHLLLIGVSYWGLGPERVRVMQNVRLLVMLPLVLGLWAAIAGDAVLRWVASQRGACVPAPLLLALAALFLLGPMVGFVAERPDRPGDLRPDPLADWLGGEQAGAPGRVWLGELETPWYTYTNFDSVRAAGSHFLTGEWSLLATPLNARMSTALRFDLTEEYLRAMAVSYAVIADGQPLAVELAPGGTLVDRLQPAAHVPGATVYRMPWTPVEAFVAAGNRLPALNFPDSTYRTPEMQTVRDGLVREYNALAYSDQVTPVRVRYPSPISMEVWVPAAADDRYLVVSENWDRAWRAQTGDGRPLRLERFGPNYIGVDLAGIDGATVVELRHGVARDWQAGGALTLFSLPLGFALAAAERRVRRGKGA